MKNWKTTVGGVLTTIGVALQENSDPIIHVIGLCLMGIGPLVIGHQAADK